MKKIVLIMLLTSAYLAHGAAADTYSQKSDTTKSGESAGDAAIKRALATAAKQVPWLSMYSKHLDSPEGQFYKNVLHHHPDLAQSLKNNLLGMVPAPWPVIRGCVVTDILQSRAGDRWCLLIASAVAMPHDHQYNTCGGADCVQLVSDAVQDIEIRCPLCAKNEYDVQYHSITHAVGGVKCINKLAAHKLESENQEAIARKEHEAKAADFLAKDAADWKPVKDSLLRYQMRELRAPKKGK